VTPTVPDIFRAIVSCLGCGAVVAFGAPVVHPLTAVEGLLTAGLLLGAGVDLIGAETRHREQCGFAAFRYDVQEVARAELAALAPWLGIGT